MPTADRKGLTGASETPTFRCETVASHRPGAHARHADDRTPADDDLPGSHTERSPPPRGSRDLRQAVVPARGDVPVAGHGRDGCVRAQHRDPLDPARPRGDRHRPAVDLRLVRDRVRRVPAHRRRARRPVRSQAGADVRARRVRAGRGHRHVRRHLHGRHRQPERDGVGRGIRDAVDAVVVDVDLPARRSVARRSRCGPASLVLVARSAR